MITNKQINERIKELWEDAVDISHGNGRWYAVAERMNEEFSSRQFSANSCRKRYGRYVRGHKNTPVPTMTKQTRIPQQNVPIAGGNNALIIGDTHIPFQKKGYLTFLLRIRDRYKCDTVIHIGDVVDFHATSFWDSDPDGMSAGSELEEAKEELKKWNQAFPKLKIAIGNHDARPIRKIFKAGLPATMLKSYNEILGITSEWEWQQSFRWHGIHIEHGKSGGKYATMRRAEGLGRSVVMGHTHHHPGVTWLSNGENTWFGMNVGCGLDAEAYAFRYATNSRYYATLGCGVVLHQGELPLFIPFND